MILIVGFMKINTANKYVHIYDTVKEAFVTDKGYSKELSRHMSEKVFNSMNAYKTYAVDDKKYKAPFKIKFSLKEKSQSKKDNAVYVNMIYSIDVRDSENKEVGGSWHIPVIFTVKQVKGEWYITHKYEDP